MVLNLSSLEKERFIERVGKNITEISDVSASNNIQFLNLANNKISNLPQNLKNLQCLILSMNSISVIPSQIKSSLVMYQKLETLDLSNNSIKDMGNILESLPMLKKINLFCNKLSSLSFSKTKIEHADLAMNRFTSIPACPETITYLNLDRNKITAIEFDAPLSKLVKLCVSKNEITSVTSKVAVNNLYTLDLSYNKLAGLPNMAQISQRLHQIDITSNRIPLLPVLPRTTTEIYASNNKLRTIPDFISTLSNLTVADFSHNYIKEINVTLPSTLQLFNIIDNNITTIATSSMVSLMRLFGMQNKLADIPNFTGGVLAEYYLSRNNLQGIKLSYLSKNVMKIDVSHNDIQTLPKDLFTFPSLTHLFLGYNQIKKLPASFSTSHIICLSLVGNPIEAFPEEFPQTLEQLYISDCNLEEIPENLKELEDFIELDASNNKLTAVPELPHLMRLILSKNNLIEFPKITNNLEYLDLSFNSIPIIPKDENLKKLKYLDLAFNDISAIPKDIVFEKLNVLKLQSNPLVSLIRTSNFPALEYIDVSSTAASFDELTKENLFISASELSLCKNMFQRCVLTNGKADYAIVKGIRETREDGIVVRSDYMTGVNLYSLVDGKGGSLSSMFISSDIAKLFTQEDDIFTEENMRRVHDKIIKDCVKKRILSVPDYGIVLTYSNELLTLCTGLVSMLIIGRNIREITSNEMLGKPRDITTFNRTHGPINSYFSEGETLVYHIIPEVLVKRSSILPDDKWLLILSSSIRDSLTIDEIAELANNGTSPGDIAYSIRNAAQGNMCCDNISVVAVDLSSVRV